MSRGGALLLALAVPALGVTVAGLAAPAKTTYVLTINSQVGGYPYSLRVAAANGGAGGLSISLTRRGDVGELHDYRFGPSVVTLTARTNLSRASLDTQKGMGRFGKLDVVFKPSGPATRTDLKCSDGKTVYGTRVDRSGSVGGMLTFNADTNGTKYFGRLSNRGNHATLPSRPGAVLTKVTVTQNCPRPSPSASRTPSPRPTSSPSSSAAAVPMALPYPAGASACQHSLTLATTQGRSLKANLGSGSTASTLALTYTENAAKTAPATVSHALLIPVTAKQHPFTVTFSSNGTTAHLSAKIGRPEARGGGSFSGPVATSTTQGSCETKSSVGTFTGNDLRLVFDTVSSGRRTVVFSKKVAATLTQAGDAS